MRLVIYMTLIFAALNAGVVRGLKMAKTIDLRDRCTRCGRLIRGKSSIKSFEIYKPFCSFHCQEWHRLESCQRHLSMINQGGSN